MPVGPELDPETPSAPSVAQHRRRGLLFVGIAAAGVGFALTVQVAVNSNFVADEMHLAPFQQGMLEAVRESCGIVALGVLAVLAGLAEPLVGAAALALLAVGLGAYSVVPTFGWLLVASLVWSQGFHVWLPLPQSMTLALAEPGRAGYRLGQIRSAGAVGAGAGLIAGLTLTKLGAEVRSLFVVAGAAGLLAAGACLAIPRGIKTPGPRLVFRRKYGLYYLLCFLEGWRKQIAVAFAGYLLVRKYRAPLIEMLYLSMGIHAISWAASPLVGKLIDRVGERRVLVFYFAVLTGLFVCYAAIPVAGVLYAIYVIDGAMFVFAMSLTTYVNRIAPKSEHTPTLSMGVAMNHIAAVTMPLVGGLLWRFAGHEWVFYIGAAVAALSILPALRIPRHTPPASTESP
jgi:hypothetical protein